MSRLLLLACSVVLLDACVRDAPAGPNDPADANTKTAPISEGSGVLSTGFDADSIAPDAGPPTGHDHHQHGSMGGEPAAPTAYTCPHHPEVVSDKPGTCPKCGMDLVPKNAEPRQDGSGDPGHAGH